jgi:Mg2+-importing ATPase
MAWMGPISSIFDILTYLGLYFMLCPAMLGSNYAQLDPADATLFIALFQTGWFVESMWTQSLVVLALRTEHLSILRSSPAPQLIVLTLIGIGLVTLLPYVPDVSDALGLAALPAPYYPLLFAAVAGYLVAVTLAKLFYKRRYGSLL